MKTTAHSSQCIFAVVIHATPLLWLSWFSSILPLQADAVAISDGARGQFKLNMVLHKLKKSGPVPPPPPEKDFIPNSSNGNDGEVKPPRTSLTNSSSHPPMGVMKSAALPACDSYQQVIMCVCVGCVCVCVCVILQKKLNTIISREKKLYF